MNGSDDADHRAWAWIRRSATYFETLLCATTGEKVQNRTLAKVRSEFRSAQCETLLA